MLTVENIKVYNIARAVYSARNPMDSWAKSDSDLENDVLGPNDLGLAQRLYKGGTEHRKYLRQIFVTMDVTAPLFYFKELDTYKVGTTVNSCSTMHKIHAKEFTLDDFSHEHLISVWEKDGIVYYEEYGNTALEVLEFTITALNHYRNLYLKTNNKKYWWQLIELLPSSYNQRRTITMNYENVMNMINQRENHKLDDWRKFVGILRELPYVKEFRDELR